MLGRFTGREVAIVGMGKSNQSLCRYLVNEGARITCFDRKTAEELGAAYGEMSCLGVKWSLGERYLEALPEFRWAFLTPGMKKNLPEVRRARHMGAVVSNEIALFLERCKATVAGVTGSAGKTTACTLAGIMLQESLPGTQVYVGGNIGAVLIEKVDSIPENALVILELSSFQLELLRKSPEAGLILNIRPNHLDVHDSYQDYVEAKKNIFRFQGQQDWCMLNLDDPVTRGMEAECPGRVGYFTLDPEVAEKALASGHPVAWLDGEELFLRGPAGSTFTFAGGTSRLAGRKDFLVPGQHNVSNALGAALLTTILGATPRGIGRAIGSFRGVEHRIEFVRELRSVRYYNDSIATSPDRTEALLEAVPGPLVLIMGGYDKGLPFDELAEKVVARECTVVTLGKTAPKLEEALLSANLRMQSKAGKGSSSRTGVTRASSLEEAVRLAASRAAPCSSVVLSPACASFDMFANFEERGARFKEIVRNLT